jgi:Polyketide cyclase / dehydrase and lipid transport
MMNGDMRARSLEIHWPPEFSPDNADVFAHHEVFIKAPVSLVWRHLVEAEKWPLWYPNARDVRILNNSGGALQEGVRFAWTTFGLAIQSRVFEFLPTSRLGWFGKGAGLDAYQAWLLIEKPRGCQVVMEKVMTGPGAIALHYSDPDALHRGYDLWNSSLKRIAEG